MSWLRGISIQVNPFFLTEGRLAAAVKGDE